MELSLTFLNGEHQARTFDFQSPRAITVGRSPGCDIVISDTRVSRQHCRINLLADRAEIKDLGSANGTCVNDRKVGIAALAHGDRIGVSDIELKVALVRRGQTERLTIANLDGLASASLVSSARFKNGATVEIRGYEVVRCLGEGAFGAVFEARGRDGHTVALKVAKIRSDSSDADRLRFLREAETAASLQHPNVVRVLDRGESGPTLYIVMEFVRGESLHDLMDRSGPLPVNTALLIGRQIASALEAARLKQVVHRDVKPDNILMREDGIAKLADFGFAKCLLNVGQSGLTHQNDVVGTIAYMSPEQLGSALNAEHRSDIYSLGATLYHMLTGETPFTARTNMEYFMKIITKTPEPLERFRKDIPPIVSKFVLKCLSKDPKDRYQTAGEMARILTQLVSSAESRATVCEAPTHLAG